MKYKKNPIQKDWDLDNVCELLASGKSLQEIAAGYGKSKEALWQWLNRDHDRRLKYLAALTGRGFAKLEEIEEIVADVKSGAMEPRAAHVALQGLQWVASRLNPQMLSDKWKAELSVGVDTKSIQLAHLRAVAPKQITQINPMEGNDANNHRDDSQ